jgi:hypothetical protein
VAARSCRFKSCFPHPFTARGYVDSTDAPQLLVATPLGTNWGQHRVCIAPASLVFSAPCRKNPTMASFEQRAGRFRIVFRYAGQKFNRSIKTTNEKDSRGTLARLEDNLRRLGLGALLLPEAADIVTFLLSDGNVLDPSCHPSARWANYSATILRRSPPMALSQLRFGRGLHQSIRNKPASSPCFSVPAIVAGLPPRDSTHLRIPSWSVVVLETCFMAAVALVNFTF